MILHIDFSRSIIKLRNYVVVAIQRNSRGKITYSTGLIYLQYKSSVETFKKEMAKQGLEVYMVDVYGGDNAPEGEGKGYWCPYCKTWNYWEPDPTGCKVCPVCDISDAEFYVKKHNGLWVSKMANKKDKKFQDGVAKRVAINKKNDKRRKKK